MMDEKVDVDVDGERFVSAADSGLLPALAEISGHRTQRSVLECGVFTRRALHERMTNPKSRTP